MKQVLFDDSLFTPGLVCWNTLALDRDRALEDQLEDLDEDLLLVEYPNGVVLDVGWYPGWSPDGEFCVALNDEPEQWQPFTEQRCRSIRELEQLVIAIAEIAKSR